MKTRNYKYYDPGEGEMLNLFDPVIKEMDESDFMVWVESVCIDQDDTSIELDGVEVTDKSELLLLKDALIEYYKM